MTGITQINGISSSGITQFSGVTRVPGVIGASGESPGAPFYNARYDLDFINNVYFGGTMNYTNNNDDGRLFRQFLNFDNSYIDNEDGTTSFKSSSTLRRGVKGLYVNHSRVNVCLWNRDLTNVAWVKVNATALKNQTGTNGGANQASSITATADSATILQTITDASKARFLSFFVKRISGSGTLEATMDGGLTWTAVTVTAGYSRVSIPTQTLANPIVGFRIGTSGDSFAIDFVMSENATVWGSPVDTTSSAMTFWGDRPASFTGKGNGLPEKLQGAFGFYSQIRSPLTSGGLFVSDGNAQATWNSSGDVTFGVGGSTVTVSGQFIIGMGNINKVAGYLTSGGVAKLCVNGGAVVTGTGTLSPSMTHFDLGTNGNEAASIHGVYERFSVFNAPISDADMIAMTSP